MLTRGQLKVNTQIMSSDKALRQLGGIIDRMSMAIVIAGLFIGSSVVYYARIEPVVFGIPVIGFMGYVSALVLALMLGREIWRNSTAASGNDFAGSEEDGSFCSAFHPHPFLSQTIAFTLGFACVRGPFA